MRPALIGIDWGSSNMRGWALDADGAVLAHAARPSGITAVTDGGFAAALRGLAGDWTDGGVPIVLGGMIGSRQGWREAPYLPLPRPAGDAGGGARCRWIRGSGRAGSCRASPAWTQPAWRT